MKLVSAMGSLARQRFTPISGDPQWLCMGALSASKDAQLNPWQAQAAPSAHPEPDVLVLTLVD